MSFAGIRRIFALFLLFLSVEVLPSVDRIDLRIGNHKQSLHRYEGVDKTSDIGNSEIDAWMIVLYPSWLSVRLNCQSSYYCHRCSEL